VTSAGRAGDIIIYTSIHRVTRSFVLKGCNYLIRDQVIEKKESTANWDNSVHGVKVSVRSHVFSKRSCERKCRCW